MSISKLQKTTPLTSELQEITKAEIFIKEKFQSKPKINWFVFYTYPRAEKVVYQKLVNGLRSIPPYDKIIKDMEEPAKKMD